MTLQPTPCPFDGTPVGVLHLCPASVRPEEPSIYVGMWVPDEPLAPSAPDDTAATVQP